MQAFAIVEADVAGAIGHCLFQVFELLGVHHLHLETPEVGLHVRVVPAVALAAHAGAQSGFIECSSVFPVGVLRPW